ncbi:MAG: ComEC/Rec2 family competence protein [Clostridia bacterium]
MEVCAFAVAYFLAIVLKVNNLNNILYVGVAILFVAILVCSEKIVFKAIFVGITLSTIIFNFYENSEIEHTLAKETHDFYAVAIEIEEKYDTFSSVIADVTIDDINFKSKIYFQNEGELIRPSDEISGNAYVYIPTYKTGFDRENYYKSDNINVLMSANYIEINYVENFTFLRFFSDLQLKIKGNLEKTLNFETSAFVKGLVLGDKSDFDEYFSIDITKIGISHILAVSGMHVGFLASLCMLIFGKRYGFAFAGILVTMFLFVVGFKASILRAVIMQYMIIIAWFIGRENSSKISVWVAFVILLAYEPYMIYDIGFVLSFLSSIGIIYLYEPIFSAIKTKYINKFILSSVTVSICVTIMTTFACFYYFGYISTLTVLSNLIILPIIAVLFPLCIIYILISLINTQILLPLAVIIEFLVLITTKIITFLATFKYALSSSNNIQIVVLLILITVCTISVFFKKFQKTTIFLSVIIFTLAGIYAINKDINSLKINVLAVGDGQCIVVTYKNEVTLIDCASTEYYSASKVVNEFLYKYSYEKIDNLIITSIDSTHLRDVLTLDYDVLNIVYPDQMVRADANEILLEFLDGENIEINGKLPDYIEIFDDVDKKLAVKVYDTLILHAFTNLMLEQFLETNMITAETVVLADKTIGEYRRLEASLMKLSVSEVILSNDYDMLSRVSGFPARTTVEYSDILINYGENYGE